MLRLLRHSRERGARRWPLWTFLVNTGLRIGKALALRWANVDHARGWVAVAENLDRKGIGRHEDRDGRARRPADRAGAGGAVSGTSRDRRDAERRRLGAD